MPNDDRGREIILPETSSVAELAPRLGLSSTKLISTAFQELGLILTINEPLQFEKSSALVAQFGFVARRETPPQDA